MSGENGGFQFFGEFLTRSDHPYKVNLKKIPFSISLHYVFVYAHKSFLCMRRGLFVYASGLFVYATAYLAYTKRWDEKAVAYTENSYAHTQKRNVSTLHGGDREGMSRAQTKKLKSPVFATHKETL